MDCGTSKDKASRLVGVEPGTVVRGPFLESSGNISDP